MSERRAGVSDRHAFRAGSVADGTDPAAMAGRGAIEPPRAGMAAADGLAAPAGPAGPRLSRADPAGSVRA